MQVFAAGTSHDIVLKELDYPNVLVSFMAPAAGARAAQLRDRFYTPAHLLLDSGAFTAWAQGREVDVDAYADWCHEVRSWHPSVIVCNVDVIPGVPGRHPTSDERRDAAARGEANAERLRSRGLPVMEVYHRHEPLRVLTAICDRRRPYEKIAFGGLVGGKDTTAKVAFCDRSFRYLFDRYTRETLPPIHGFGLGPDSKLGQRYYWHSVDCSSWLAPGTFGHSMGGDGRPRKGRGHVFDMRLSMKAVLMRWQSIEAATAVLWETAGVHHDLALEETG